MYHHLIAIQNRNDAKWLPCCINSILSQPRQRAPMVPRPIRIVGIDAGSDDNSLAVYEKYSKWLDVVSCPGLNQAAACNKVIRRYWDDEDKWETFTWINADDWFTPDFLELQVNALLGVNPTATPFPCRPLPDIVCSDAWIFYQDQPERGVGVWSLGKHDILERFSNNLNYVCQPTVMTRRRVFETCGLFDESIVYPFDYEFWRRCANWGMRFHHTPHPTAWRRDMGDCFTKTQRAEIRAEMDEIHARYKTGEKRKVNPL